MAEEALLPGVNTEQIANAAGTIGQTLMYVLLFVMLLAIVGMIWWLLSYKKRVLILERRKDGIIFNGFDRARQFKTREGVVKWKLMRNKIIMNRPPSKSLYGDHKGREIGIAFLEEGTIAWPEIEIKFSNEDLTKIAFIPFSAEDRSALAHEFRESDSYKKKRMMDIISQLAPLGALVIIIALLLLFTGDFMKSVSEPATILGNKLDGTVDKINIAIDKLDTLVNNRQVVSGGTDTIIRPPN